VKLAVQALISISVTSKNPVFSHAHDDGPQTCKWKPILKPVD